MARWHEPRAPVWRRSAGERQISKIRTVALAELQPLEGHAVTTANHDKTQMRMSSSDSHRLICLLSLPSCVETIWNVMTGSQSRVAVWLRRSAATRPGSSPALSMSFGMRRERSCTLLTGGWCWLVPLCSVNREEASTERQQPRETRVGKASTRSWWTSCPRPLVPVGRLVDGRTAGWLGRTPGAAIDPSDSL